MKLIQACQLVTGFTSSVGCSALDGVWSFFRVFGTFGFRASHGGRECLGVLLQLVCPTSSSAFRDARSLWDL